MHRDHWGSTLEAASFAIYEAVIRPGETAVDCGVNLGLHSYAMARLCGPKGRLYGFEPVPDLLKKAQAQNAAFSNITWINKAALDAPGRATFHYFPVEHGWSGLRPKTNVSGARELKVELTTLDAEVAGRVALMKLDIEGAEFPALRGARRIMTESAPVIVFENGRATSAADYGYTQDDFFGLFEELDYNLYTINGVPFAREMWDDNIAPWQFLAVHRRSPRLPRVMAAASAMLDNAAYVFAMNGAAEPLPDFAGL